jgi:tetratricopeptide (TPR) repeat protein
MTALFNRLFLSLLAVGIVAGGCASSAQVPTAPPPRRPPEDQTKVARDRVQDDLPEDCAPVELRTLPPSLPYRERSVVEAKNLADQGFAVLKRSESTKIPRAEREEYLTEAVEYFLTALKADPYNVHATYNLAAAYARIGRAQCSVTLLERLDALHKLPSQRDEVEDKLDRLLGRGRYRNNLDPDFRDLRDMEIFREVVRKLDKSR